MVHEYIDICSIYVQEYRFLSSTCLLMPVQRKREFHSFHIVVSKCIQILLFFCKSVYSQCLPTRICNRLFKFAIFDAFVFFISQFLLLFVVDNTSDLSSPQASHTFKIFLELPNLNKNNLEFFLIDLKYFNVGFLFSNYKIEIYT